LSRVVHDEVAPDQIALHLRNHDVESVRTLGLLLSTNPWPTVQLNVGNIAAAVETAEPGKVTTAGCIFSKGMYFYDK
jgi:hypothetical protein